MSALPSLLPRCGGAALYYYGICVCELSVVSKPVFVTEMPIVTISFEYSGARHDFGVLGVPVLVSVLDFKTTASPFLSSRTPSGSESEVAATGTKLAQTRMDGDQRTTRCHCLVSV